MTPSITEINLSTFEPQLKSMLQLQESMNTLVFPNWIDRKLAWHRAIYIEAGEYLEHLGSWKWWKKGQPDFPQANMELVDIWHFGLSWYMVRDGKIGASSNLVANIVQDVRQAVKELDVMRDMEVTDEMRHEQVDQLVAAAGQRVFDTVAFVKLLAFSGMDFDQLALSYMGKNMLNRFRQDNGYKTGTYRKVWGTLEDNVHLEFILSGLGALPGEALAEAIYAALDAQYRAFGSVPESHRCVMGAEPCTTGDSSPAA